MDQSLFLWIHHGWSHPVLDVFFAWLSQTGWFSMPLLAIIATLLWRRYGTDGLWLAFTLVAITIVGDQLGGLLKYFAAQYRPCAEIPDLARVPHTLFDVHCSKRTNGMPSNHAWNFFAAVAFLAWSLRSWRLGLGFGIVALLVSLSRIYLGVHYPSQVLAGALFGIGYGLLAARLALQYLPFAARMRNQKPGTP